MRNRTTSSAGLLKKEPTRVIDREKLKRFKARWTQATVVMESDEQGEFINVTMPGYITFSFMDVESADSHCDTCHFYNTSASRGGWTGD